MRKASAVVEAAALFEKARQLHSTRGRKRTQKGTGVSTAKPWGNAAPLAGCAAIHPPQAARGSEPPVRHKRPAVLLKVLLLNRFLDATARELHPSAAMVCSRSATSAQAPHALVRPVAVYH